jgi:group I intron endonuclease
MRSSCLDLDNMELIFFYMWINLINGKAYIGQTNNLKDRKRRYLYCVEDEKYDNAIHRAIRKYGLDNFLFVHLPMTKVGRLESNKEEKRLIKLYNTYGKDGYNMSRGGEIISDYDKSGKNNPMFGRSGILSPAFGKVPYNKGMIGSNAPQSFSWKITFEDGRTLIIKGRKQWAKENGYNDTCLSEVYHGTQKRHKDIIKVERI